MVAPLFFKIFQSFKNIHILFLSLVFISNSMVAMDSKKVLIASIDKLIKQASVLSDRKEALVLFDCLVEVTGLPCTEGNLELTRLALKSLKDQLKSDIKGTQDKVFLAFFDEVCKAYRYAATYNHANQVENPSSSQIKNDERQPIDSTSAASPRALNGSPLRKSFTPREIKTLPEE